MAKDLLFEIGTEELPPKNLFKLSQDFKDNLELNLEFHSLIFQGKIKTFATPRRLAVIVKSLEEKGQSKSTKVFGPGLDRAKDTDGNWTRAATGFASKFGVQPDELIIYEMPNGEEKLAFNQLTEGVETLSILPKIITDTLSMLPISKRMRWGAGKDEFVRPVHWSVMLYGEDIVPATILGTQTTNQTRGHRFHCHTTLEIANPAVYEKVLKESGHVIADFIERRNEIRKQVNETAKKIGGVAPINEDLLDEVTSIVEWPVALAGSFDEEFLQVPQEALISTMQGNQKYFPVTDKNGKLLNHFIFVANIDSKDPKKVIEGNERVIRPRFSDAKFFFDTDKQTRLEARLDKLKNIVFQQKLGTVYEKSQRISQLAGYIAKQIGADAGLATRAGLLAKTDLVSEMVLEFDTMQGIAGYYYAQHDGESPEVACAIRDQYLPKFAGDQLPDSLIACAVGLADRLDTLVGIFGIGQPPTGSKDPFALRRASLSVLRILVEKQLSLDLFDLVQQANIIYEMCGVELNVDLNNNVFDYVIERFRAWYEEERIPVQVFQAVYENKITEPLDFDHRVKAVHAFYKLPEAESLAAANKRVSNILSKHEGVIPTAVNESLLQENSEKALAASISQLSQQVGPLIKQRRYEAGLTALAAIRDDVDNFFDSVMVNVDDARVRDNRLALLQQLRDLFLQVADISLLAGSSA